MNLFVQFRVPNFRFPTRAFTLVETALALLAISLGLLGIFGLARHGLKNSGDTENETRCTLLADTVFETLRAKNDELAARKFSLYNWWIYWLGALAQTGTPVLYLPALPEISDSGEGIGLYVDVEGSGKTHTLGDSSTAAQEIKWNPVYALTFTVSFNQSNLSDAQSISEAYERGQIDVTLTIHPGQLQSGAATRTFYTTLTYTGGMP